MVDLTRDTLLTTDGAAEFLSQLGLHISASYLASLRSRGGGPTHIKWGGKVRYRQNADLVPWAKGRLRVA
jgi:hypothetical protein